MQTNKVLKIALPTLYIATFIALASTIFQITALFIPRLIASNWRFDILPNIVLQVAISIVLIIATSMLAQIRNGKTPFSKSNIKKLNSIGLTIILLEPVQFIVQILLNNYRPLNEVGMKVEYRFFSGGIFIALGLVIFCLAYIFKYGMELQKLSDETL